jgi:hypothetical protein
LLFASGLPLGLLPPLPSGLPSARPDLRSTETERRH